MTITHQKDTNGTLEVIRQEIAADDPLLAGRLKRALPAGAGRGFADLFNAACTLEIAGEAGSDVAGDDDAHIAGEAGSDVAGDDDSDVTGDEKVDTIDFVGAKHYREAIESILEGYLLHYGNSRLFEAGSAAQNLLTGDYMYAYGLGSISQLGDLDCISMLAGLVSICSLVHCERRAFGDALTTWSVVTLCLARRASGREAEIDDPPDGTEAPVDIVASVKKSFWDGNPAAGQALEKLLAVWPPATAAKLRGLISDIYSSLWPLIT